MYRIKRRI